MNDLTKPNDDEIDLRELSASLLAGWKTIAASVVICGCVAAVYAIVVLAAGLYVARRLVDSPFGLAVRGVHENRVRMAALGTPVLRRLLAMYTAAGAMAGVAVNPGTPRAQRRVDAEQQLRFFGRATGTRVHALRIPGIYASDREGGTPRPRLLKGTAVLQAEDDVYTNHIHANDLARACIAALWRGLPQRVTNVSDDTELKMGDYFDLAADLYQLPRPPRVARDGAQQQLPVMLLSFMSESRRLDNTRMKRELRIRLRYPTAAQGLASN